MVTLYPRSGTSQPSLIALRIGYEKIIFLYTDFRDNSSSSSNVVSFFFCARVMFLRLGVAVNPTSSFVDSGFKTPVASKTLRYVEAMLWCASSQTTMSKDPKRKRRVLPSLPIEATQLTMMSQSSSAKSFAISFPTLAVGLFTRKDSTAWSTNSSRCANTSIFAFGIRSFIHFLSRENTTVLPVPVAITISC